MLVMMMTSPPHLLYSTYSSVWAKMSSLGGASKCSSPPYLSRIDLDTSVVNSVFFFSNSDLSAWKINVATRNLINLEAHLELCGLG